MTRWDKRRVIGRRIVDVELRAFPNGKGGQTFNPQIILDNGRALRFIVEETEVGEYGVRPVLTSKTIRPATGKRPKPRIRKNAWDNWYGYLGNRRVMVFANAPTETQEQQANRWLAERIAER
jgi:hypothetical protein